MPAPSSDKDSSSKLFVGGLLTDTDEEVLKKFYGQWGGEIVDCIVMRDNITKRSRGFGFVTFADIEQVDEAMKHRPHVIEDKEVDVKRAIPREFANKREAQTSVKRIYVSGIKDDHDETMLREHFSQYGNVVEVDIVVNKETQQKRGFAFVSFDDYDAADKAVLLRHHQINGKRCDCRKALSKEEMAKLQHNEDRQLRGQRARMAAGYGGDASYNDGYYGGGGWGQRGWGPTAYPAAGYGRNNGGGGGWGGQPNDMYGGDAWNSGGGTGGGWGQGQSYSAYQDQSAGWNWQNGGGGYGDSQQNWSSMPQSNPSSWSNSTEWGQGQRPNYY